MSITNINENSQTNQYKKPSTLFFNDMTNIEILIQTFQVYTKYHLKVMMLLFVTSNI